MQCKIFLTDVCHMQYVNHHQNGENEEDTHTGNYITYIHGRPYIHSAFHVSVWHMKNDNPGTLFIQIDVTDESKLKWVCKS